MKITSFFKEFFKAIKGRLLVRNFALFSFFVLAVLAFYNVSNAQTFNLDLGNEGSATVRFVQLIALITVISLAPSILIMVTSFIRIVVVLSILRTALGTPQAPSNLVVNSLALFLTFFIMQPTLQKAWEDGLKPYTEEKITEEQALIRSVAPMRDFMLLQVREQDLLLMYDLAKLDPPQDPELTPLRALIPAFMISELRRAFEIGFLIFIPFVIIDIVVATVLMSLGMMFLPPVTVALPFKLIFFVLIDGWFILAGSLVQSFRV